MYQISVAVLYGADLSMTSPSARANATALPYSSSSGPRYSRVPLIAPAVEKEPEKLPMLLAPATPTASCSSLLLSFFARPKSAIFTYSGGNVKRNRLEQNSFKIVFKMVKLMVNLKLKFSGNSASGTSTTRTAQ